MSRDPRYDVLFEPVQLGPVTTKNRFYQVPHCTGMAANWPRSSARYREIKAEGGWGVVCTEECMIHPSADHTPSPYIHLWDDDDIAVLTPTVEGIHRHGALAGVELSHAGVSAANRLSRDVPLSPSAVPYGRSDPVYAKSMTRRDITDLRRWHKNAALRAKRTGFDIVYVYCGHNLSIAQQFLAKRYNKRTDEYGGSLENRVRLLRELLEDTLEAVNDKCAVALRFSVEEFLGADEGITHDGEARDVVGLLAELPDLWDVNVSDWPYDSGASRFFPEGYQSQYTAWVKTLTSKPVVGVGRFTSPDAMVSAIRKGHLDLIGSARPSIADPFLPAKIDDGRIDDIRECIGCNMCTTGQLTSVPMRCTQNPVTGEEWRRGWHPERIASKGSHDKVLVVGAGPAGLECALALGNRGYEVLLAEATHEVGGRLVWERKLPGLSEWGRVVDYRVGQLRKMAKVDIYYDSPLSAGHIIEFAIPHVVLATGSTWNRTGIGRVNFGPVRGCDRANVYSVSDVLGGKIPPGSRVLVFDDDHYYMAPVLAESLVKGGANVTLVTPAAEVSNWARFTLEWPHVQRRLAELKIEIITNYNLESVTESGARLAHLYDGPGVDFACDAIVMVTGREPNVSLVDELSAMEDACREAGIKSVTPIADCVSPASIAAATYAGHRYARELDEETHLGVGFKLERVGS